MAGSVRAPRWTAEERAAEAQRQAALVQVTWRTVAGPPGAHASETSLETPARLEKLGVRPV